MDEIAFIAAKQGRDAESEDIYRQVLALREAKLGPRHLTTLTSVNNLACTIQNRGNDRLAEAEKLHRRAFEGRLAALGPKDPKTLKSMRYLTDLLASVGKKEESRELSRRFRHVERRPPAAAEEPLPVEEEDGESDGEVDLHTPTTDKDPTEDVPLDDRMFDHQPASAAANNKSRTTDSVPDADLLTPSSSIERPAAAPEVSDRTGAMSVVPILSMPPPGAPPLTPKTSESSMAAAATPAAQQQASSRHHAKDRSLPELVLPDLPKRPKSRPSSFQGGVRTPRQRTPELA